MKMVRIAGTVVEMSKLVVEGSPERAFLRNVCATITARGAGSVRWRRVGDSDGSGKERSEGEWDQRPITKAYLNDNGNGILYMWVTLDPAANKGTGVRKIRIDSLLPESITGNTLG